MVLRAFLPSSECRSLVIDLLQQETYFVAFDRAIERYPEKQSGRLAADK